MFEKDNQIIKIYGTNKLLSVKEAFNIEKVKFEFREFDKNRQAGEKTTGGVDIYMDIEKFTYFCEIMKSGRIYGLLRQKAAEQQGRQAKPAFEDYGGRTDGQGNVLSRVMSITSGEKYPIILKAGEGPGTKGGNGQIIPNYNAWKQQGSKNISIALSDELAVEIGIAGSRALQIYDIWVANGTAEQNLQRIAPKKADAQAQSSGYQQPRQNANDGKSRNESFSRQDQGYGRQNQGGGYQDRQSGGQYGGNSGYSNNRPSQGYGRQNGGMSGPQQNNRGYSQGSQRNYAAASGRQNSGYGGGYYDM